MQKEKLDLAISVIAASVFILLLFISGAMIFRIYLKRKNKLLLEKERMAAKFEQTLLQSKLEIQEQAFTDISREIHDNIGQVLSLARININTINAPQDSVKLNLVDELMEKALSDLRSLSHSLDADIIRKKGWLEMVRKLLTDLQKSGRYEVTIEAAENLPLLGNEKPIILFRMIQEMVNNIIRHAGADKIMLDARRENEKLLITVTDNGRGFNTDTCVRGAGLQNLQSRAKMIDADLYIRSEPGSGTSINIALKTESNE